MRIPIQKFELNQSQKFLFRNLPVHNLLKSKKKCLKHDGYLSYYETFLLLKVLVSTSCYYLFDIEEKEIWLKLYCTDYVFIFFLQY